MCINLQKKKKKTTKRREKQRIVIDCISQFRFNQKNMFVTVFVIIDILHCVKQFLNQAVFFHYILKDMNLYKNLQSRHDFVQSIA